MHSYKDPPSQFSHSAAGAQMDGIPIACVETQDLMLAGKALRPKPSILLEPEACGHLQEY